ncbi:MAG TPA: carbohydrate ABC transporter permease [Anaerolineales bacterium]|nr:carbohydrate ABC transporter permease [Anaerolineales bacterium]
MSSYSRGIMSNTEWRSPAGRFIKYFCLAVLVLAGIFVIFPFVFSFTAGLQSSIDVVKPGIHLFPAKPLWNNYLDAWRRFSMIKMFKNTFVAAGGGVLLQILVSALAAYSLSRLNPIGKNVIRAAILITMAIPGICYLIPRYILMTNLPLIHVSLVNSFWGLWIPYACNSFMILVLTNTFEQIPKELFEAAQVDGAGEGYMFFKIAIPLSSSIILILGLLAFIGLWGDFLWPYLILRNSDLQTVSVRLYTLTRSFPINLYLAGSFIAMLPPTIASLFLARYVKGGLTF